MKADEALAGEIRRRASDGQLPCAAALKLADDLGVPRRDVGEAANALGVKIVDCQLGCFGRKRT